MYCFNRSRAVLMRLILSESTLSEPKIKRKQEETRLTEWKKGCASYTRLGNENSYLENAVKEQLIGLLKED